MKTNIKPELLVGAGSLEKMKIAFEFGADAVYFGVPDFSLRARINKFGKKEISQAAELCKKLNKKFYITINIYAHNKHIRKMLDYLKFLGEVKPDGVIVSDPGVLKIIKERLPKIPIHLSTQANATNFEAVEFWRKQGVNRVILARELSFKEICEIHQKVSKVGLEIFVHGAMCMSYSGRCILSKWMVGRSANLGDCAQPCRWKYFQTRNMSVIDDKKRFEIDLEEDEHGTYFFNSQDLCLLEEMENIFESGVSSLKIEGRAKSVYYVAVVTKAYRKVIDAFLDKRKKNISENELREIVSQQKQELEKLAHRGYSKGFLLGNEPAHLFNKTSNLLRWEFVGIIVDEVVSKKKKVFVHNVIRKGDEIEVVSPSKETKTKIFSIISDGKRIESAHGGQNKIFEIEFSRSFGEVSVLRKKVEDKLS